VTDANRRQPRDGSRARRPDSLASASLTPLTPGFYARDAVTVARELLGALLVHALPDGELLAATIVETEAYREDDPASHSSRGRTPRTAVMFGEPGRAYVYFIYGMYDCFNVVCEPEHAGAAVLVRAVRPERGLRAMWENRFPGKPFPSRTDEEDRDQACDAAGKRGARRTAAHGSRAPRPTVPAAVRNLTSGPGKLCRALLITRAAHDGATLTAPLEVSPGEDRLLIARPAGVPDAGADDDAPGTRTGKPEAAAGRNRWPLPDESIVRGPRVGITKAVERPWRFSVAGDPFVSR